MSEDKSFTTSSLKLDEFVCFAIYSANNAVNRLYQPLLKPLGLTYTKFIVLKALWDNDKQTVGDICKTLFLESNTLTPLLKRMETENLLSRTRNPSDERQVIIALTDKGKTLKAEADCLVQDILAAFNQELTEIQDLTDRLQRVRDNVLEHLDN